MSSDVSTLSGMRRTKLGATKATQGSSLHENRKERLTKEEEEDLLRHAVELRRLNNLENDLAMSSPTKTMPLVSVRAQAAGYGSEIFEYEDAKLQGQLAREALVTRNMGLVHYCVSQILGSNGKQGGKNSRLNSLSREDLIQEGAIGLARAVDKWNPAIGGRFSTYAMYWIRASVFRCIAERDDVVRVPDHVSRAIYQINRAAKKLGMDLDDANADIMTSSSWQTATKAKQLAEEAGLTDKQMQQAMKARSRRYSGGYIPFDSWMQQGKDLVNDVPTLMTSDEDDSQKEHLRSTLSKFLRPKEMEALSWRYGLVSDNEDSSVESAGPKKIDYVAEAEQELFGSVQNGPIQPVKGKSGEAMSFPEVAKRMQVSAEYTRRLCHAAVTKLQRAAEEGRLEPTLLMA